MSNRCALRIPDLHSEGLLQVQPRPRNLQNRRLTSDAVQSCWICFARFSPFQNLFKDSSQNFATEDSKTFETMRPRGKMFSCSMVSQILFIWSSLRAPPMRRFFCTWSPKWKTAEAILGSCAVAGAERSRSVSWWISKAQQAWLTVVARVV